MSIMVIIDAQCGSFKGRRSRDHGGIGPDDSVQPGSKLIA